jgi:hypothetical protein
MNPCRTIRRRLDDRRPLGQEEEAHLFACEPCRRRARADRRLAGLSHWPAPDLEPSPVFVAGVMARVRGSQRVSHRLGPWAWAAAAALFAFGVGYGSQAAQVSADAAEQVAELAPAASAPLGF